MKNFVYHFKAKIWHPLVDNMALISFSFESPEVNTEEIFKMAVDKALEEVEKIAGSNSDEWILCKLTFKSMEPKEG